MTAHPLTVEATAPGALIVRASRRLSAPREMLETVSAQG